MCETIGNHSMDTGVGHSYLEFCAECERVG